MAQRGIREYDAKKMLAERLPNYVDDFDYDGQIVLVTPETDLEVVAVETPGSRRKGWWSNQTSSSAKGALTA